MELIWRFREQLATLKKRQRRSGSSTGFNRFILPSSWASRFGVRGRYLLLRFVPVVTTATTGGLNPPARICTDCNSPARAAPDLPGECRYPMRRPRHTGCLASYSAASIRPDRSAAAGFIFTSQPASYGSVFKRAGSLATAEFTAVTVPATGR